MGYRKVSVSWVMFEEIECGPQGIEEVRVALELGWASEWEADSGLNAPRRRTLPAGGREDRALSSRERSTSRGRTATRSSSRESNRGARGHGRPAHPSPSPTGQ